MRPIISSNFKLAMGIVVVLLMGFVLIGVFATGLSRSARTQAVPGSEDEGGLRPASFVCSCKCYTFTGNLCAEPWNSDNPFEPPFCPDYEFEFDATGATDDCERYAGIVCRGFDEQGFEQRGHLDECELVAVPD